MKTIDYVKKYKLSESDQFSHKYFAIDFGNDFISRLEVYKTFSSWSVRKFFDLVDEMENKWNQIDKKTAGNLPEKLWYYIYNEIIIGSLDVEFPYIYEKKQIIDEAKIPELRTILYRLLNPNEHFAVTGSATIDYMAFEWDHQYKDNSIGELGLRPNYSYELIEKEVEKRNDYLIYYCFDELTYQLKKLGAAKAKIQLKIHVQEKTTRKNMFNWFDYIFSQGIRRDKSEYEVYFSTLGLGNSATEEQVKTKYKELAHKHHPDKGGNKETFVEITEAKNKCMEYFVMNKR